MRPVKTIGPFTSFRPWRPTSPPEGRHKPIEPAPGSITFKLRFRLK